MSFIARRLRLEHFRNRELLDVELSPGLTVFVGPNAAGKTNIIEALQLTTAGRSFRTVSADDLIREGADESTVELQSDDEARVLTVRLTLKRAGRKNYTVNGSSGKRASDVRGKLPSVIFTPDDLALVKSSAEARRSAIDDIGEQLSSAYEAARREYSAVLRQRNRALREEAGDDLLAVLTEQLVITGARLTASRARLMTRIADAAAAVYEDITQGETLQMSFLPSWDRIGQAESKAGVAGDEEAARQKLKEAAAAVQNEERVRATSVFGPHRDDVNVLVAGRDARVFGSQGQQRTVALAWKLAEVAVISEVSGARPLL
ncbi:MAG: DNA replication and repair protein RecF, partial [Coriobacteriia bacterium]|nr:DNA replication and repair protein RecF [Coriobacteriia bacterium]